MDTYNEIIRRDVVLSGGRNWSQSKQEVSGGESVYVLSEQGTKEGLSVDHDCRPSVAMVVACSVSILSGLLGEISNNFITSPTACA